MEVVRHAFPHLWTWNFVDDATDVKLGMNIFDHYDLLAGPQVDQLHDYIWNDIDDDIKRGQLSGQFIIDTYRLMHYAGHDDLRIMVLDDIYEEV